MDQRDAKYYQQQIKDVTEGNIQMRQLIEQQTHILDVTANLVRKEKEIIDAHYNAIHHDIKTIQVHEEFVDALLQVTMSMTMYKDTQGAIIDVLSDIHHGRVNTQLITPSQLEEQLRELQQLIPNTARIPTYQNHWIQTYKILNMRSGIVQQQIIFELTLPLLQRDEFQIYNILPVPTPHEDKFIYIEPSFAYVLVNLQRSWYYPITKDELTECTPWEDQTVICKQQQPLHNMQSEDTHCEMAVLDHQDGPPSQCTIKSMLPTTYLTHLHQSNSWILVLAKETVFDVVCKDQVKSIKLKGTGIITIKEECAMRGRSMLIVSHASYQTKKHLFFLPSFNLSTRTDNNEETVITANLDEDLQLLEQSINKLKEEKPWNNINHHHIHQYAVTSLLIIGVVALLILWWQRKELLKRLYQVATIPAQITVPARTPAIRRFSVRPAAH